MTVITVRLQHEAIHRWPDAPLDGEKYLVFPHRHVFHIEARKAVGHNDRDIEIIAFKRKIKDYLMVLGDDWGTSSCEQIAENLKVKFSLVYCSVLEDGENGAIVYDL